MRKIIAAAIMCAAALPAVAQIRVINWLDGSGTITAANVSQQVFGINSQRNYLMCQNPIASTNPLMVNIGAPASTTGGSIELAPGGSMTFAGQAVPVQAVNVTAATAGQRFICKAGV